MWRRSSGACDRLRWARRTALFTGLEVLAVDRAAAWQAGEWRRDFATTGITLWQADCLIAATAKVNGATLVTGNPQDFPMPELEVAHWPTGQ